MEEISRIVPPYLVDQEQENIDEIKDIVKGIPELEEYKNKLFQDGNSAEVTLENLKSTVHINVILSHRPYLKKYLRPVSAVVNLQELQTAIEVEKRITEGGSERAKAVDKFITERQKTYQDTLPSDILYAMKQAEI